MIKKIITALLLTASMFVMADSVLYNWTPPTSKVDGSVLLPEEIVGYSIRYEIDGVPYPHVIIGSTQSIAIPGVAGTWVASIATMTAEGIGPYSEDLTTVVDAVAGSVPTAPTNFTMTILCGDTGCALEIN